MPAVIAVVFVATFMVVVVVVVVSTFMVVVVVVVSPFFVVDSVALFVCVVFLFSFSFCL